ncbi:acyltransferase family protein [Erwinia sp. HR93]|uniref:acyltransferase family protein n=1 Tax=Erwinia sp. HR93 TaxID=3094840 RepID=UPI002ADEDC69|nr:acyltransferase family protein [Erwinia sp. HR93]MEA1064758.1 acyltransferase family protein [Erwinia sp. HR93]
MGAIKYRPDIDGLRAIAVMLVIFYHVGFKLVSGGFIGVDIFFVISGYLITSIIRSDFDRGVFSFSVFYARRIKRIVPALFVVILVTSITSFFILFPDDLSSFSKSVKYTSLSIGNLFFIKHGSDYFSQLMEQAPLLHTWSLAVEEQFYIIWPLLLFVSFKLLRAKINSVIVLISFFAIISCIYSSYLICEWPVSSYYSLGSRVFELLIGCLLALLCGGTSPSLPCKAMNFISVASLVGLLCTGFLIGKSNSFPGFMALIPCLLTALFIMTGKDGRLAHGNAFISSRPFVYIGKISYPMYLWHWPIIAFVNYRGYEKTTDVSLFIILITVVMAMVTYTFVEKPIQRGVKNSIQSTVGFVLLPMVIASVVFGYVVPKNKGFEDRFPDAKSYFKPDNVPNSVYKKCFNSYRLDPDGFCVLGAKNGARKGMLIGDSMAGHYMGFVNILANDADVTVYGSASSGLPPVYSVKSFAQSYDQRTPQKLEYNLQRLNKAKGFDFVILAGSWGNHYPYFQTETALEDTVRDFIRSGIQVYVIGRPNAIEDSILKRAIYSLSHGGKVEQIVTTLKSGINYRLDNLSNKQGVKIIDPNEVICAAEECKVALDGQILYLDTDHITEQGARILAKSYLKSHTNPFSN